MRGEIEFRDVWFWYPSREEKWVLKGINFKINANENIGLVGKSGSGKSSITALIFWFYDPEFG